MSTYASIRQLSVICKICKIQPVFRASHEIYIFFYMMKKSRQWEEWRKRMAGANGYGGETIIVYTDYLLFLATSYV